MKIMLDATKPTVSAIYERGGAFARRLVVYLAGFLLVLSAACDPAPHATSERSAAPAHPSGTGSPAGSMPQASAAAPTVATSAADPCIELRKAVVAEASKLSVCKKDVDCKVHPIQLCNFSELDCYAAHVNKQSSTADLDDAVSAYAKSCPPSKCKCAIPEKSVCNNGKCSARS